MSFTDALGALADSGSGCEIAAFTDLSSGMVLATSGTVSRPRELMDALAAEAVMLLDGAASPGILAALGGAETGRLDEAVVTGPGHTHVFVRAPDEPTEALALICRPDAPVAPLIAAARAFFATGTHGGENEA